jgi:hypothetical protein
LRDSSGNTERVSHTEGGHGASLGGRTVWQPSGKMERDRTERRHLVHIKVNRGLIWPQGVPRTYSLLLTPFSPTISNQFSGVLLLLLEYVISLIWNVCNQKCFRF